MNDYCYDIECYLNFFSCAFTRIETGDEWFFEISDWVNQAQEFFEFLQALQHFKVRLVGYNNEGYDYTLIHFIMLNSGRVTNETLYATSQLIIKDHTGYKYNLWPDQRFIPQCDLYRIHHFDNKAKRTSLKLLEFNMKSHNIKDLPYDPRYPVTYDQARHLCVYNKHDVSETIKFYKHSLPAIKFRDKLSKKYDRDFTNHNDTKIGKDYFIMELDKAGIRTKNVRTIRDSIRVADILLPYIQFEHPEFQRIHKFFYNQTIDGKDEKGNLSLKGAFKDVNCTINGFTFVFGAGGIHGSVNDAIITDSDTCALIDIDVASYYPNLAIKNNLYPEHLGEKFCDIYEDIYKQRKATKKGSPENAMLKLALNGVYGESANYYSKTFLDLKFTCAITINGQLLLCMLAERLMQIPGFKMIQINTDGLTFLCPRDQLDRVDHLTDKWETMTQLELEDVQYSKIAVRDVNNYLAVKLDGKVKRIGCYAYVTALEDPGTRELPWHKNHSQRVVAMAAEAALVHGTPIPEFIYNHTDYMDFMLRTKVPRSSSLVIRKPITWGADLVCYDEIKLQNISRYYVSIKGGYLTKIMPPLLAMVKLWDTGDHYEHEVTGAHDLVKRGGKPKSGKYKLVPKPSVTCPYRRFGINVGLMVTDCSNMDDFNPSLINHEYYIEETRKIVDKLFV